MLRLKGDTIWLHPKRPWRERETYRGFRRNLARKLGTLRETDRGSTLGEGKRRAKLLRWWPPTQRAPTRNKSRECARRVRQRERRSPSPVGA